MKTVAIITEIIKETTGCPFIRMNIKKHHNRNPTKPDIVGELSVMGTHIKRTNIVIHKKQNELNNTIPILLKKSLMRFLLLKYSYVNEYKNI